MTKILTEIKTIEISNCTVPGVYLRWKNDFGFIDQWLFQGNIKQEVSITDSVAYQNYIDDLLGVTKNFEVINKGINTGLRIFTTF